MLFRRDLWSFPEFNSRNPRRRAYITPLYLTPSHRGGPRYTESAPFYQTPVQTHTRLSHTPHTSRSGALFPTRAPRRSPRPRSRRCTSRPCAAACRTATTRPRPPHPGGTPRCRGPRPSPVTRLLERRGEKCPRQYFDAKKCMKQCLCPFKRMKHCLCPKNGWNTHSPAFNFHCPQSKCPRLPLQSC